MFSQQSVFYLLFTVFLFLVLHINYAIIHRADFPFEKLIYTHLFKTFPVFYEGSNSSPFAKWCATGHCQRQLNPVHTLCKRGMRKSLRLPCPSLYVSINSTAIERMFTKLRFFSVAKIKMKEILHFTANMFLLHPQNYSLNIHLSEECLR
jgi:hypothetical protein